MVPRLRRLLHGKEMNPLFDQVWYLEQYPDVRAGELDPAARRGGRARSPTSVRYIVVSEAKPYSGENPLVHFYSVGAKEGRDPIPLFNVKWYLEQNPDQSASFFDAKFYLKKNPDAVASGTNPLQRRQHLL
jgi:hypothetical protein